MLRKPVGLALLCLILAATGGAPASAARRAENGRIVFAATEPGGAPWVHSIYSVEPDGGDRLRITDDPTMNDVVPVASPDGSAIAISRSSVTSEPGPWCAGGLSDVDLMTPDGVLFRNVSNHPAHDGVATFSPDSRRVAFQSQRDGDSEIYVAGVDGTGATNLTNSPGMRDSFPAWSPDGAWIAFTRGPLDGTRVAIFVMRPDGSGLRQVTRWSLNAADPDWAPDGRSIAFHDSFCDTCGEADIFVLRLSDGRLVQLTDTPGDSVAASWSPDGRRLVYHEWPAGSQYADLFVANPVTGRLTNITNTPDVGEGGADWTDAAMFDDD